MCYYIIIASSPPTGCSPTFVIMGAVSTCHSSLTLPQLGLAPSWSPYLDLFCGSPYSPSSSVAKLWAQHKSHTLLYSFESGNDKCIRLQPQHIPDIFIPFLRRWHQVSYKYFFTGLHRGRLSTVLISCPHHLSSARSSSHSPQHLFFCSPPGCRQTHLTKEY